jgi:hypothetical protein
MERSGRTKVAISPSSVELGTRLAATGERRRDIFRKGRGLSRLWETTERGETRGDDEREYELRRVCEEETETKTRWGFLKQREPIDPNQDSIHMECSKAKCKHKYSN